MIFYSSATFHLLRGHNFHEDGHLIGCATPESTKQYSDVGESGEKKTERKHELFKKHVGSDTFINIKLRLMSSESSHKKKVRITQRKPIKRRSAYTTWKMYFFHGKLPAGVSYTRNLVVRRSIRGECTRIITIRQFLVIFLCFFCAP